MASSDKNIDQIIIVFAVIVVVLVLLALSGAITPDSTDSFEDEFDSEEYLRS